MVTVVDYLRRLVNVGRRVGDDVFGGRLLLLSRVSYALLLLAALAAGFMAWRAASVEGWSQHSIDVRSSARQLVMALQDAIIRERGMLLTGDQRYLGEFQKLMDSLAVHLDQLDREVADNAEQSQRVDALRPKVMQLKQQLQETVALMRNGQQMRALEVVRSNEVLELSDEVKSDLAEFIAAEQVLLDSRQAQTSRLQKMLLGMIGISLLLAAALSVVLARATRRFVADLQDRGSELADEVQRHRETEETLRQAQKMEAIGQLTGGIAHDFNNLLTVIIGNLDTLKRHMARIGRQASIDEFMAKAEKQVDMAMQASRNAAKLTHRLLAFARRQPLEPTRVDCNRLITNMSDLLRRTLGETVNLEIVLGGGLWPTFVDANQLESALINLAVNARHAMPDSGRLTIETTNAYIDEAYVRRFGDLLPGQYVQVSVADTGTGIAPDVLSRVFEPFFTTKSVEAGSGLGLAMVHGFVKQSGGHVRIYSEVGHGTTVKIYLPRLHHSEQVATPAPTGAVPLPVTGALSGETILVVEDNDGVREYASGALQELGYAVIEAVDAAEAMRHLQGGARVDLLFTDVVLPGGVSGRQLSDSILEMLPGLPVLFTTGYTRNAIVHHGRLDPDVNLLNKPYTQADLLRKIRELLDRAGKRT